MAVSSHCNFPPEHTDLTNCRGKKTFLIMRVTLCTFALVLAVQSTTVLGTVCARAVKPEMDVAVMKRASCVFREKEKDKAVPVIPFV